MDKPDTLFDQLRWLSEAGFAPVDVFWLKAGHAIYGGQKARLPASVVGPVSHDMSFEQIWGFFSRHRLP